MSEDENKDELFGIGYEYLTNGEYENAAKAYEKYVDVFPDKEGWATLGHIYINLGEDQKAIDASRNALKYDSNHGQAIENLGVALTRMGESKKAIEFLKKAVEDDQESSIIWQSLGFSYYNLSDYEKAINSLEKAIIIDPDHYLSHFLLSASYSNLEDHKNAINSGKMAVELSEDSPDAWNILGWAYFKNGDYDETMTAASKALKLNRKFDAAWLTLGCAYFGMEEYENAIEKIQKAIQLFPENYEAWYYIGRCYYYLKDFNKAVQACQRCLKIKPDFKDVLKLLKKLKKKGANIPPILQQYLKKEEKPDDKQKDLKKKILILKKEEKPDDKQKDLKKKTLEYLKKAATLYDKVTLAQIGKRIKISLRELSEIIEDLVFDGEINVQIQEGHLIFLEKGRDKLIKGGVSSKDVEVKRGGDWKIQGAQSIFYYKVKVKNISSFVVTNFQILLTSIPRGLSTESDRYKIDSLKPGSFESPTFKLKASESCVGDIVEGIITYTDPKGNLQTINIEPFEICYVCNLLTPKHITREEYDKKIESMEDRELVIESDLESSELEKRIAEIVKSCNFALLEQIRDGQQEERVKLEGYAEGLYDKQDVALSIAVKKVKESAEKGAKKGAKKGSKIVIKAMSDRSEKVTDLLKDFSIKLDDIKSDTELIKEYTSQIEDIFDKTKDLEGFLIDKLGSDFQNIKHAFQQYKAGEIGKGGLIKEGLKMIGKKFIKKIIGSV